MNHPDEQKDATWQIKVRSGLKSGASMESCENNIAIWQDDFNKWYNEAVDNGYKPPFPNPVPNA